MIDDRKIRALVVEELGGATRTNVRLERILEQDEIRALKIAHSTARRISESGTGEVVKAGAMAFLSSDTGRRVIISLLKVIRTVANIPNMAARKIGTPIFNKAVKMIGIDLPFTAEDIFDFLEKLNLGNLLVDEIIEGLSTMSKKEYEKMVEEHGGKIINSREPARGDQKMLPSSPERKSEPRIDIHRDMEMLPEPIDERRIRALVVKELARIRR